MYIYRVMIMRKISKTRERERERERVVINHLFHVLIVYGLWWFVYDLFADLSTSNFCGVDV
jgi:hypothetical protein